MGKPLVKVGFLPFTKETHLFFQEATYVCLGVWVLVACLCLWGIPQNHPKKWYPFVGGGGLQGNPNSEARHSRWLSFLVGLLAFSKETRFLVAWGLSASYEARAG